jgi:hypothetical protein
MEAITLTGEEADKLIEERMETLVFLLVRRRSEGTRQPGEVETLAELRKLINAVNYFKPASILKYLQKVAYQISDNVSRYFSI